jgi:hypothetical protein
MLPALSFLSEKARVMVTGRSASSGIVAMMPTADIRAASTAIIQAPEAATKTSPTAKTDPLVRWPGLLCDTRSDRNDQSALIDDAQFDAVVGGSQADDFAAYGAARSVGGWIMKDIWTKPTLGTFH